MARKKNSAFVGSPIVDVVRDASIYARTIDNAAGDLQLLYDRVTGENSHTSTELINHKGAGNGCPMNIPAGAQTIKRALRLVGLATEEDYYILTIPVFIPTNQTEWIFDVDVDTYDEDEVRCEVRSTSWSILSSIVGTRIKREDRITLRFRVTLGAGWQYLAVKRKLYLDDKDGFSFLTGWRLFPQWLTQQMSNGLSMPTSAAAGNNAASLSTLTPSVAADNTIDAQMTAANSPLDPWVLTRLNRMIGAMWEYLTGAPVPGNNTITLSTTRDHSRTSFTAEPLLELPMVSVGLSAMSTDSVGIKSSYIGTLSTASPVVGPIDFVRYPMTTTSGGSPVVHVITRNELMFPSFNGVAGSSSLAARVLILDYNTGGIGVNWQARLVIGTATSSWVTFANIAGTNLYSASFSSLGITLSGGANQVRLEIQNTSGSASITGQEIIVLGYSLAYTP